MSSHPPVPPAPSPTDGGRRATWIAVLVAVLLVAAAASTAVAIGMPGGGQGIGAMGLASPRVLPPRIAAPDTGETGSLAGAPGTTVAPTTTAPATTVAAPPAPDTKEALAFVRDGGIWIADADGSNARALTRSDGPDDPGQVPTAWTPDGEVVSVVLGSIGYSEHVEKVSLTGARQSFDRGRDGLEPGDDRTSEPWLALTPPREFNEYATLTQHTRGCGQCWSKSVVGIWPLRWEDGEGEEQQIYTFTDAAVGRVEFAADSRSLYVLQGSETGESATLTRISADLPSTTNPAPLEPPIQLIGIEDPIDFAVGPRGELATVSEKVLTVRDPDGRETGYGAAAGVAFGQDPDTLYVERPSGSGSGTTSVWLMRRSDPTNARKILDNAGDVVVRPNQTS